MVLESNETPRSPVKPTGEKTRTKPSGLPFFFENQGANLAHYDWMGGANLSLPSDQESGNFLQEIWRQLRPSSNPNVPVTFGEAKSVMQGKVAGALFGDASLVAQQGEAAQAQHDERLTEHFGYNPNMSP